RVEYKQSEYSVKRFALMASYSHGRAPAALRRLAGAGARRAATRRATRDLRELRPPARVRRRARPADGRARAEVLHLRAGPAALLGRPHPRRGGRPPPRPPRAPGAP